MKRVFNLLVVDESGSMEIIRKQALVGINETLETIRKIHKTHSELEQRVTLITFDSTHKKLFYDNVPADDARNLSMRDYCPCGGTPLYDAIGMGIAKINAQAAEGDNVLVTIRSSGRICSMPRGSIRRSIPSQYARRRCENPLISRRP